MLDFFRLPQCDIIYEILSKSGQNAAFSHYTQNISVNRLCKFIPELG